MTDLELLHEYSQERSQQAIETLVRRHVGWVNAVALRRVRDSQLAEDVTQAVFFVLAHKPPVQFRPKSGDGALSAWLFKVTCYAANRVIRGEARRKKRERAYAMEHHENDQARGESSAVSELEWKEIAPQLDDAVLSLGNEDRQAVLLRFYQQKSHADVAQVMGISQDAARKRIERAIAKLRHGLARRGVSAPTADALGISLAAYMAPIDVSPSVMQAALSAAAAQASTAQASGIAKGILMTVALSKAKLAIAGAAAVALLAGGTTAVVLLVDGAPSQLHAQVTAAPASAAAPAPQAADQSWREPFSQVYRLTDGEVIKRIAPPYLPHRAGYWQDRQRSRGEQQTQSEPAIILFHWDGALHEWSTGWGYAESRQPLQGVLTWVLRMQTYDFEAPREVLRYPLAGDWIVRRDAPTHILLESVCQMIREEGGPSVRFRMQEVTRPVFVARGTYSFKAASDAVEYKDRVVLHAGPLKVSPGGGGGSTSLPGFLQRLGSHANIRIIDEVTGAQPGMVSFAAHASTRGLDEQPLGAARDEKVHQLLEAVSRQTGLQFTPETRKMSVWIAEPAEAEK